MSRTAPVVLRRTSELQGPERERLLRRCRSAFMDADISRTRWEDSYPRWAREEVLAGLHREDIQRMGTLRQHRGCPTW